MDTITKVLLTISCLALVQSAPRLPRLSLAQYVPYDYYNNIDGITGIYSFGYDVSDPVTGNTQHRSEERHPNGTVTGSYGFIDPYGRPQKFRYIADKFGYRVYEDILTTRPYGSHQLGESTESSITWTRPPKPTRIISHLVTQLGNLFTRTNY